MSTGNGLTDNQPSYIDNTITNITLGAAPSSLVTVFFTLPDTPPYSTITNATIYSGTGLSNTLTSISSQSSSISLTGLEANTTYNGFYLAFTYSDGVMTQTPTFSVTTRQWYTSSLPYTVSGPLFGGGMCCSKIGDVVWGADNMSNYDGSCHILYSSNYGQNFSILPKLTLLGGTNCGIQCDDSGNTLWFTNNATPYRYVNDTDTLTDLTSAISAAGLSYVTAICANSSTNQYVVAVGGTNSYAYSTDGGTTFTAATSSALSDGVGFQRITMDNTGQYVVTGSVNSNLVVSTNYGVNFNAASSTTANFPSSHAIWGAFQYNYSGSMLIAALAGIAGRSTSIFTSTDHGDTWNTITTNFVDPNGWVGWQTQRQSIAVDITGTKIVLTSANSGEIPAVTIYSYNNGYLTGIDPSLNTAMPSPYGVTSDISGNFYIYSTTDSSYNSIVKYYK